MVEGVGQQVVRKVEEGIIQEDMLEMTPMPRAGETSAWRARPAARPPRSERSWKPSSARQGRMNHIAHSPLLLPWRSFLIWVAGVDPGQAGYKWGGGRDAVGMSRRRAWEDKRR